MYAVWKASNYQKARVMAIDWCHDGESKAMGLKLLSK